MVGVLAMLWLVVTLCLSGLAFAADNNLTKLVTWDNYSLSIQNQRTFIFAGEFHYQRLPVPELWPDIFQKFRAQGLNTVSIYFFWSYHSPSPGVYDFDTGAKNVQRLLDAAKEAGLWVIARPGPYCNAESNAGGLALWTTDGAWGNYRTGDEKYYNAWLPWTKAIGEILRRNQITNGGPVVLVQIENELDQTVYQKNHTLVKYMEQLKHSFRESGIVVPFTHNEKGMRRISWSTDYNNVGGAVNVYGLDSYPGSLSCTDPNKGFKLVRNYHEWFKNYSYTQPSFIPEFQAGWFQPHGGSFYDQCATELDPAFVDVYYKNNIGQRVTMMALYMAYGGTSWGHSAAPVVSTIAKN
jgi:beta-galactosidase GanA